MARQLLLEAAVPGIAVLGLDARCGDTSSILYSPSDSSYRPIWFKSHLIHRPTDKSYIDVIPEGLMGWSENAYRNDHFFNPSVTG
ncbi:hypothetical protein [Paraburkholderia fungorum]|uniref:hypothetical protein n=1 Tax=Paraburkholderia fungorum TaxID=134537 RepID=UPI0011EA64A6